MTAPQRLELFVNYYCDENNITKTHFATNLLGMKQLQDLYSYVGDDTKQKTKSELKDNAKLKILENLGLNLDWYKNESGDMIRNISNDIHEIKIDPQEIENSLNLPVYDLPVHANVGVGYNFDDLPMSYKPLNFGMKLSPLSAKVFRVFGDSMRDSHILSGAYIVVDTKTTPSNHCEVLANHNGLLIVKHYEQSENGFKLYSQNGGKHEYLISESDFIEIIGVVKLVFNYR